MAAPVVLDEDTYTEAISFIIQRDFFPKLAKMKAQQSFILAEQSGSFSDLQEAKNVSVNFYFEQNPELENRVNLNLSLDQFQSLYTSEDNSSFTEILEKANLKAKEKNKWFFDKESNQLKIEGETVKLVEGPLGWKYKAKNALMYYPGGESESWVKENEARGQPKAISYGNTDMPNFPNEGSVSQAPSDAEASRGNFTPWTVRINNESTANDSSPSLRGFGFVETTPTLNAQQVGTPQMTWGAIEGTPMLIEGSTTPGPRFSLPQVSRREQLGMRLSEKASKAYRKKTNERITKGTPRLGAGLMSPAAQHLLRKSQNSPHIATNSFGNALRSAYSSSPLRPSSGIRKPDGTPTPVALFRAGTTPLKKNQKQK
ncbi:nuclear protein Es2-domain-containing protein [Sporodiniella umbellata]|nr:nuclear protein Es2-domain-containing protein [Sporodiniella umbellata]